jgi:superfamily II DNA/RNA helicase
LAPPGTVRMVSHPTNLMSDGTKDRGELENGGRLNDDGRATPRLFIGSAKSIMVSLYGNGKMPAPPTTKPEAKYLLQNTKWVVLDEVDRLLDVNQGRGGSSSKIKHEKPAAVVTSAVARLTIGRAQVISASATVGRSLKRELSRILGLSAKEWPAVVRGSDNMQEEEFRTSKNTGHLGRAVTIPDTVKNYVVPVDTSSVGKLVTSAFYVLKSLNQSKPRRILLVLTKGSGINTQNTIGALKHFSCKPEPKSLLDVLEADGTDRLIEVHRDVSGAIGIGETKDGEIDEGYLLVTGEDTIRGLHLDGLDVVVVVGKANGPDEYTHIAGRTGRAGREGIVINVVSDQHAAAIKGWEKMLDTEFREVTIDEIASLN